MIFGFSHVASHTASVSILFVCLTCAMMHSQDFFDAFIVIDRPDIHSNMIRGTSPVTIIDVFYFMYKISKFSLLETEATHKIYRQLE